MKAAGRLLSALITVCLCLLVAAQLWLVLARTVLGQDLPLLFGFGQVVVVSGSMEPAFSAGDLVIIRAAEAYEPGDIITYRLDGAFVTHRVVGRSPEGLITRGDANNAPDRKAVTPAQIAGRVVLVLPGVGRFIAFLQTPAGVLLLAAAGLAMLALPAAKNRERREPHENAR